jgi:TRAP-type transport system periplasmic protein
MDGNPRPTDRALALSPPTFGMNRRHFLKAVGASGALALVGCNPVGSAGSSNAGKSIVIRLGHSNPPAHPVSKTLETVSATLAQKTSGRITMVLFGSDQLGTPIDTLSQVTSGTIQMNINNPPVTSQISPKIGIFAAPYLFPSLNAVYKAAASPVGQQVVDELRTLRNIRALDPWYLGTWHINTKNKPIHQVSDMVGLKLRVPPGPVMLDFMSQCGASPAPMSFNQVYLSLQASVIDGLPITLVVVAAGKLYEVTKYFALTHHLYDIFHPLINEDFWKSLSSEDQTTIREAFLSGRAINDKLATDLETSALTLMASKGMQVDSSPDLTGFQDAAKKTRAKFADTWGGASVLNALSAAGSA